LLGSVILSTCTDTPTISIPVDPFQSFSIPFNPSARDQNVIKNKRRFSETIGTLFRTGALAREHSACLHPVRAKSQHCSHLELRPRSWAFSGLVGTSVYWRAHYVSE